MKSKISILLALIVALAVTVTAFADTKTIYSDVGQNIVVYGPLYSYAPPGDPAWGSSPVPAVLTWKHAAWPMLPAPSPAKWISNTYLVDLSTPGDSWRWFRQIVPLCPDNQMATNISGTIRGTSDNAEEVYVNGALIGSDGTVQGPFVDHLEWSTIVSYNFSVVQANSLVIDFIVRNGGGGTTTDPKKNPTGLIFDSGGGNGFTYSCQKPHLSLVKTVINDNGGTAVAASFNLKATGPVTISGAGGVSSDVPAGTYVLSESGPAGYGTSGFDCGASVTLAAGENKTCTIINDDIAPKLHLRKVVINDNGGTATAADFTLMADGTGSNDLSGTSPVDSGPALLADTWTLSESGPVGYASSVWSCVGGTQNGSKISVGVGQEATCTITNDDIAPKLHLRKVVINDNGGTATVADFTLMAAGTLANNSLSGISPVDSGPSLLPDTWVLSEAGPAGYSASDWSCVGGTQNGSSITLGLGQEATCTITNDDKLGTIIVQKMTKPANTGSFAFDTTGTGFTAFSLAGGTENSQTLPAGTYTVRELVPLGWQLTSLNCTASGTGGSTGMGNLSTQSATIDLNGGDTVTCVFEDTGKNITRTQGFWSTHPQLANTAWFGGSALGHTLPGVDRVVGISDKMLCGRPVDTLGKLMGGFLSDIARTTTGTKRSALDQARMQLLQQMLAAELNAAAFGTTPVNGSFAAWESAYCGTNVGKIKTAQQQAASFNTSGDSVAFSPGGPADRKTARSIATLTWWNVLP